jgi:hypothetical protein
VQAIKAFSDENIERGYWKRIFVLSLVVRLLSKCLTIVRILQSFSGTATNPKCYRLTGTIFDCCPCWDIKELKAVRLLTSWQERARCIHV